MQIIEAQYLISCPSVDKCPKPDRPEYAFIGRSNVGKSSLINLIANNSRLAKTSSTPGKTKLLNFFDVVSLDKKVKRKWYLVDLPGYGFANVSQKERKSWEKMIQDYIRKRENLVNLFVLIDSRHDPQPIDLEFVNQLGGWGIPFAIVFTKADKNKPGATKRNVVAFLEKLGQNWEILPQWFVSSAITKEGYEDILKYIGEINKKLPI